MSERWDRRSFLRTVLGAVPVMAVGGRAGVAGEWAGRLGGRPWSNGLPPRVIGLRTDGGNFRFDPVGLVVEPGSSVVWLNMGDFHSTTAFHPDNANLIPGKMPLRIPEGAESWHSGMLGLTDGTEFAQSFTVEGVYDYFCQPHYMFGMVGRIVVGAPHDGPGTTSMDGLPDIVKSRMPALASVMGAGLRPNEWASRFNGVLYLLADGQDPSAAATNLQAGLAGDSALTNQSGAAGNGAAITAATKDFVDAVHGGVDYETLVRLADAAKEQLAALVS
jgi:plastocyanin